MRRKNRGKKAISNYPIRCIVFLSSNEEHNEDAAERKEDKQLRRIQEFVDANNLIPVKIIRRGILAAGVRNEFFKMAIRWMQEGKAEAIVTVNMDAISSGIADAYYKIGMVKESGYRLFTVDEKEPVLYLYTPPKSEGDTEWR